MECPFSKVPFSKGVGLANEAQKSGWGEAARKLSIGRATARAWRAWYEKEVCTPLVLHEGPKGIRKIGRRKGHATDIARLPLVAGDMTAVEFAGKVYPLVQEGLYRFMILARSVRNLIVTRDNHLLPILQGLSALHIHGYRDQDKTQDELKALLPTCSFIGVTCGTIASLAASLLKDLGFKTRMVSGLALEDWNTYDNGHVLFEAFCPSAEKWILADVDMGFLFRRKSDHLDAGEVWECFHRRRAMELVPLANTLVDPFFVSPWGFNWFLPFRYEWQGGAEKLRWYRRIFQAVAIEEGGKRVYVGEREKIVSYLGEQAAEVLPYPEWRERLYGSC